MTDIKLDASAITRHAAHLDTASTDTWSAYLDAADIHLDNGAFGKICGFLPPIVNAENSHHLDVIGKTANLLSDTATALRTALSTVGATDAEVATAINHIESRLGGQ